MPDLMRNLARRVAPATIRRHMRDQHRRLVFRRAMRQITTWPHNAAYTPTLLSELIYGWDNEGYSVRHEYALACVRQAMTCEGPILECGSGLSTLLLGLVADRKGVKVWSLEHDPFWVEKVRATLDKYHIWSVELCEVPLHDYGSYSWYAPPKERMPGDFSLVVCDGPPGRTPGGRYGMLPVMGSHLRPGCVILLDDAERDTERDVVTHWARELDASFTTSGTEKPFAMLMVAEDKHRV